MTRPRPARPTGFTLVELLVVIGIIALLISILLPSLNSARRQARSIKCLAALRQIGNGFQLYAVDYKGKWPFAVQVEGTNPWNRPVGTGELRWAESIARYMHSNSVILTTAQDVGNVREKSVVWGCPEWQSSTQNGYPTTPFGDAVRVGYGMQYYRDYWQNFNTMELAYTSTAEKRPFPTAVRWGQKGADRGLIADAITHIIGVSVPAGPLPYSGTALRFQPFEPIDFVAGRMYVDSTRHARPGMTKRQVLNTKTLNMLFCDGHAAPVSVKDVFNSIVNPGRDAFTP